jgi:acetoin utilization deacetylase AcuC-like enzyme
VRVVASDAHRAHHGLELNDGALALSAEGPERADLIATVLRAAGHDFCQPDGVGVELLGRIHTPEYIDFLSTAWDRWVERGERGKAAMGFTWPTRAMRATRPDDLIGQLGYHSFAADCSITAGTWSAVREAAAIAVTATDLMLLHGQATYGLCRPPGHHATADQFGGYCYLNNAAITAQRLLDGDASRVAILDVDYHHGNGTQAIFAGRSDVLFVSIHADPTFEFPWFAGHADEIGDGDGEGWNLNLPLPSGTTMSDWMAALDTALTRIADADVDALVVSLGVDTYEHDPLGTFAITTADFETIGAAIAAAGLPTVVLQEGGYAVSDIGANVAAFLQPLG